jgi:hypothetical protein
LLMMAENGIGNRANARYSPPELPTVLSRDTQPLA